jgi:rSAM/selenodomain-associated transferase 2
VDNESLTQLSVIIPVLNEAANIQAAIESTRSGRNLDIIAVDGGSQDATCQIAQSQGVRVLPSPAGRAHQMNVGAAAATGNILLFLHADTRLPSGFDTLIRTALQDPDTVAGAFRLRIDGPQRALRWVEWGVDRRSRWLQMPYGDQAIFVRRSAFQALGGFPELPIMEDFELIRRLRRRGAIVIIQTPVVTSARRWQRTGILQTTLINQLMILGYWLGVRPERLAQLYRRRR